jgi:hypothetical protein
MSKTMPMTTHLKHAFACGLLVAAATLLQGTALAHGSTKPAHGGIVQMAGETLMELVVSADGVALYVKEDDEDLPSAGMTAKLNIAYKGAKSEVALEAVAGNRFDGKGVKLGSGAKVGVVLLNKATQAKVQASFTVP